MPPPPTSRARPPQPAPEPLWSIGAVSSAAQLLQRPALDALLAAWAGQQDQPAITGMVLYCQGNLMVVVEGPRGAVHAAWDRIARHPAHHGLIELWSEAVTAREFAGWTLACPGLGTTPPELLPGMPGLRRRLAAEFWAANP